MHAARFPRTAPAFLLAAALAAGAQGATYEPTVGQEGKDVVWVPTPQVLVEKMLDLARVTPKDFVVDLGSGDGRTVITAAKRGARALGVEYDPDMVELSRQNAKAAGVAERAQFVKQDLFQTDLAQASVITLFLLPSINLELRPKILALRPGTRVVSNSFDMGEWEPDAKATVQAANSKCESYCTALLWIVPAQVAGSYLLPAGRLELKQEFQMLSGTLRSGSAVHAVKGRVRGDKVTFSAGGKDYRGRLRGKSLALE